MSCPFGSKIEPEIFELHALCVPRHNLAGMNSRPLILLVMTTFALAACGGGAKKVSSSGDSGGTEETGGSAGSAGATGGKGGGATGGGSGGTVATGGSGATGGGAAGSGGSSERDASVDQATGAGGTTALGEGVLTRGYHNDRTGANLGETILDPQTVGGGNFGKLFCRPVDDEIYGQLLYVPGLEVSGARHNVVVAVTMNDSVYAYDADDGAAMPLWERHFADP